ncbi:hypothetical protein [Rummeliibacillus pycnus]|uniref:hypothetical protein n=1 Tax=Rummeliibacillus pycnus TaxID=101070 RepID=UPI0037C9D461
MFSKETLLETITIQLGQGLGEIESINKKQIKSLKTEIENRDQQIRQLKEKIEELQCKIKTLNKVNYNLKNERKVLLKEINKRNKKMDFTEGITALLCDDITNEEKVKIIVYLLKIAIKEENVEEYLEEFMQIISEAITKFDYFQSRSIKRELKKNYVFYHQLFLKVPAKNLRAVLYAYHSNKMIDMIKHLLHGLVQSGRLYSYKDEDALNILLYIIYYRKIKTYQNDSRFQLFYKDKGNDFSNKAYNFYSLYSVKRNRAHFIEFVEVLEEKGDCIDLLKVEMIQYILKRIFKEVEIENYYNVEKNIKKTTPKTYRYRHPSYSELRNFGYQITSRTDEQRWLALQEFIESYGLQATANELHKRIRLKMGREEDRKRYANAIRKWSYDLNRLKEKYYENDFPWPEK